MSFSMKFDSGRKFRKVVGQWKKSVSNLNWFWPSAHVAVAKVHDRLFETEGASGPTGKWAGLSEATKHFREAGIDYYAQNGMASPEGPVLHWTFRLRDSLGQFAGARGTAMSVRRSFRNRMVFGTRSPQARELHEGRMSHNLPPRYLLDEPGSRRAVVALLNKQLIKRLNGRGIATTIGRGR